MGRTLIALTGSSLALAVILLACENAPSVTTTSSDVCARDADCTLTSLGDDCCDHCGQRAMTNKALDELHVRCKDKHPSCPSIDCPFQRATATCISNQCVAVH